MNLYLVINTLILVLFIGFGYWAARRLLVRHPNQTLETLHHQARYIYFIIAAIILAFAFIGIPMMSKTLLWRVPLWFDLFAVPMSFGVVIACFSFLFSLASTVAVKTRHPERNKIIVASIILVCAFPAFQYQHTHTVYPKLKHIKMNGVILQSHPSSCAAASAANIAERLGIMQTEKEMARRMNTSEMIGTNAGQVIHGMEQVGIQCSKRWVEGSDPNHISAPAMLFVDNVELGPESHAVAFMGIHDGKWEIWDPLEGRVPYTYTQLKNIWHGKSLECSINVKDKNVASMMGLPKQ